LMSMPYHRSCTASTGGRPSPPPGSANKTASRLAGNETFRSAHLGHGQSGCLLHLSIVLKAFVHPEAPCTQQHRPSDRPQCVWRAFAPDHDSPLANVLAQVLRTSSPRKPCGKQRARPGNKQCEAGSCPKSDDKSTCSPQQVSASRGPTFRSRKDAHTSLTHELS
jgi:hypothetical protein